MACSLAADHLSRLLLSPVKHKALREFAEDALESRMPVDLFSTRCTVFMNSKVKQAQEEGPQLLIFQLDCLIQLLKMRYTSYEAQKS